MSRDADVEELRARRRTVRQHSLLLCGPAATIHCIDVRFLAKVPHTKGKQISSSNFPSPNGAAIFGDEQPVWLQFR
eukprot:758884-Amphidinium_carterae.1